MANSKLFVSNLDFELTTEQIRELFGQVGACLTLTLVRDRESGRSRGYAFVEMASAEEAQKAIEQLNGKMVNGRAMSVAEDRGKRSASGPSDAVGGGVAPGGNDEEGGRPRGAYQPLQPMQRVMFFKKRRKSDPFQDNPNARIDYKDVRVLGRFLSERGRILPRRLTGLNSYNQRKVSKAIKRAQNVGLLPFTSIG
jgi:cold-inducible RNA-binding protein